MSIHVALTHRTSYRHERPAGLGPQTIRRRPAPHGRTPPGRMGPPEVPAGAEPPCTLDLRRHG